MAAVITTITGLQNLVNLNIFSADYNGLQSVDLSGLTNLLEVDISRNNIPGSPSKSLNSVNLAGCTALQELRLNDSNFSEGIPSLAGLTSLSLIDFDECNIIGVVDLTGLPALTTLDLNGNSALTSIIIAEAQPIIQFDGYECALTETAVDNILIELNSNGVINGSLYLDGGANAAPSALGLAAKVVLEGNGWGVFVNV